jgi:hypothetical protein
MTGVPAAFSLCSGFYDGEGNYKINIRTSDQNGLNG